MAETSRGQLGPNTPLSRVPPIEETCTDIVCRSDVSRFVEAPLAAACELLFDLNIRTLSSSASRKHGGEDWMPAYIGIDFEGLSPENQAVVEELIALGVGRKSVDYSGHTSFTLELPLDQNSTVGQVSRDALALASRFKPQPLTWGFWDANEIREIFRLEPRAQIDLANFGIVSPDGALAFRSQELLDKYLANPPQA